MIFIKLRTEEQIKEFTNNKSKNKILKEMYSLNVL